MPTVAGRAIPPPFSTPPLIKPEPTDGAHPGAAWVPFSVQASVPLMNDLCANYGSTTTKSVPYSRAASPKSAGTKSAAQHIFQQQHKAEGTRHSTGSLPPFASQAGHQPGPFGSGMPFGVPQPIRGPFAGTVFDPAPKLNSAEGQPASQADAGQAAVSEPKAKSTADGAVLDSVVPVAPTNSVTDLQLAAVNAAAEDKQAAEQFAAGAVWSPTADFLHHPVSQSCT